MSDAIVAAVERGVCCFSDRDVAALTMSSRELRVFYGAVPSPVSEQHRRMYGALQPAECSALNVVRALG